MSYVTYFKKENNSEIDKQILKFENKLRAVKLGILSSDSSIISEMELVLFKLGVAKSLEQRLKDKFGERLSLSLIDGLVGNILNGVTVYYVHPKDVIISCKFFSEDFNEDVMCDFFTDEITDRLREIEEKN